MESKYKPVLIWLFLGCATIFVMVAVGGITRLTESGLSMVDWHLLEGAKYPSSDAEWQQEFEKYAQYPEFQEKNYNYSLEEFKDIFWWEWFHRMIGRFLGVLFIIPFVVFTIQKRVPKWMMPKLIFILCLGAFQGFLGWYMVKSGLIDVPRVSHFRLAAHLSTAFFTIAYTFYVALQLMHKTSTVQTTSSGGYRKAIAWLSALVGIQIIYGAFVAGLDAGHIHNYFPHMNPGEFISSNAFSFTPLIDNPIFNPSGIQLVHRTLAYAVVVSIFLVWNTYRKKPLKQHERRGFTMLLVAVGIQFSLGVVTLIYHVPIVLGVLHQLGALVLLLSLVFLLHTSSKSSMK